MSNPSRNDSRPAGRPRRPVPMNRSPRRKLSDLPPEAVEQLKALRNEGEPVSFSESSTIEEVRPESTEDVRRQVREDEIPVHQLLKLSDAELLQQASAEQVRLSEGTSRRQILLDIIKQRIKDQGLMYGEGTLQILPDGFGFLRSSKSSYLSCADDIYVSPSQIRKFNLRNGSSVCGQVRPPKQNEKYFALLRVELINGMDPEENFRVKHFDNLTPLHPEVRIVMEHDARDISTRVVDMITPIGFGQRGLIVSPPRAGKTILMQTMARAVLRNYPQAYVIMLLVDERPEEVTDMEREVQGDRCEVISSTFDEPPARHIQVSEMVLDKAKRLVEAGVDVVLFLDSITRMGRAWNTEVPQSGKTLTGGLDANAMQRPKAFFGAARKIEEGGSLTIIATALVDTGSRMDEVIFEEFKGTGNMEIVLDRGLVDKRIWPAIDINRSGTRREEKLLDADEYDRICQIRRALSSMNSPDAMEMLTNRLKKTQTNAEFLLSLKASGI
jgi:transcription termination factor Rho